MGGWDGTTRNDVWSSSDGVVWRLENGAPPFSNRRNHQLTVFNNRLLLIGGDDGTYRLNDIWSSADGNSWTQERSTAEFDGRSNHRVTTLNNQLWLVGGVNTQLLNDVWRSSDGINWRLGYHNTIRFQ